MLSRVADAVYWMSRYVERAEHTARLLSVTRSALIDLEEVDPDGAELEWRAALEVLGGDQHKLDALVFDEAMPSSISSSLARARENARQVREILSSDVWEHLNQAYWGLREIGGQIDRDAAVTEAVQAVLSASFLWSGVSDATMRRGEGWLFTKLGQFVERADRTCRIIAARVRAIGDRQRDERTPTGENVQWITLLRSLSSLEAFRKVHPTRVEPRHVVEFVVLDPEFPRTVRYSVSVAHGFVRRLPRAETAADRRVERSFGRLAARLDYTDVDEILEIGPGPFLDTVMRDLSAASLAVQGRYFLH